MAKPAKLGMFNRQPPVHFLHVLLDVLMGSAGSPDIGVNRGMYIYICTTVVLENGNTEKLRIDAVKGANFDVWSADGCGQYVVKTFLNEALLMHVLQITLL